MHKLQANPFIYKTFFSSFLWLILPAAGMVLCFMPALAQLPPTNMGKFVHQPGDNQYSAQTQSERHATATPIHFVPAASSNGDYKPTAAAPKPDISLLPIVADEPLKPAGFPPLPDRLDLPSNSSGVWPGNNAAANGAGGAWVGNGISRDPTGVHQHYVHFQPGAFMPDAPSQQLQPGQPVPYKPSGSDYYNVNPAARPINGVPPANVETPASQALKRMGAEPQLAADAVSKPEVPSAVTVNQSVSQDLSLPEDDFNKHYPTATGNSATNRNSNGVGRMLAYPLRSIGYSAVGTAVGVGAGLGLRSLYR